MHKKATTGTKGSMQDNERTYKPHLVGLMNHIDDRVYSYDHEFSQEELLRIRPHHVYSYFAMKAFGKPDPAADDRPDRCRSSTVAFAKKAISFFMPNRLPTWNVDTMAGNPTKSIEVNRLLKRIKRHEVRREGVASQAVRPLEPAEFESLIDHAMVYGDESLRYSLCGYYKFQFHMIARVDDVAQLMLENIRMNPAFPFTLLCRVNWSKNVLEERDVSDQMLIGAHDHHYCVLLGLAIHLEQLFSSGAAVGDGRVFPLSNSVSSSKAKAGHCFKKIVDMPTFNKTGDNNLGTHSLRKAPATHARRKGCNRDDVDHRGRWKGDKRVVDRYIHCELPYPDAKVAAALCGDGAIKYVVKEGSGITNDWIVVNVTPNIANRMGSPIAALLGKCLLWAIMSDVPSLREHLPSLHATRVRTLFHHLQTDLQEGENPIDKVYVNVTGHEGAVFINEIGSETVETARNDGVAMGGQEGTQLLGLYAQVEGLSRVLGEAKADIEQLRLMSQQRFERLGRQVRRIALQPVARVRQPVSSNNNNNNYDDDDNNVEGQGQQQDKMATLVKTPRTLDELWIEYNFGVGGRKAARLFTRRERGRCRHTYCRRRVVWDKIAEMVRGGETAQEAIDRIRLVYGASLSVTRVINKMMVDRRSGGHPALRV